MWRRVKYVSLGLLGLAVIALAAAGWQLWRGDTQTIIPEPASYLNRPTAKSRVLVFAPHCDDETLGAGGLIQQAVAAGSHVRVVVMTNGDGFTLAVERQYHKLWVRPADYIRLAYLRQRETRTALGRLGLRPGHVTFLGYPDRGLMPIRQQHWGWSDRYRSSYTGDDASPYATSYTRHAPFCAASVLADVQRILQQENPTLIILPHPNDSHPDHWATYALVTYALAQLEDATPVPGPRPQVYTYLVHRGTSYPSPTGYHPGLPLLPPASMVGTGTRWLRLRLSPLQTRTKYEAIRCYRSQMRLTGRFLTGFARMNELYGGIRERTIPFEGQPGGGREIITLDPAQDSLLHNMAPGGDLLRIAGWCNAEALWLQLTAGAKMPPTVSYQVWLHTLPRGGPLCCELSPGRDPTWRSYGGGPPEVPVRATALFQDDTVLLRIPLAALHYPDTIVVSAEARRMRLLLDRTGVAMALMPWGQGAMSPLPGWELAGPGNPHTSLPLLPRDFPPLPVITMVR